MKLNRCHGYKTGLQQLQLGSASSLVLVQDDMEAVIDLEINNSN